MVVVSFFFLFLFSLREKHNKNGESRESAARRELCVCLFLLTELLQQDSILFLVFIYKNWFS